MRSSLLREGVGQVQETAGMRLTRRSGRCCQATRGHRQARQVSAVNTGIVGPSRHAGAYIKALDDPWLDTTTPHGELILTIMGGMHEFERKLIRARCDEGIKRAMARGTVFGRKSVLDAGERRRIAERYAVGETMAALAREYKVGEATANEVSAPAAI